MATKATSATLPKSGAVSKGYNFTSTWEQNAPLTEQQQAAITVLSHAVAERPYPSNLSQEPASGEETTFTVSSKDDTFEDLGPTEMVLVNTHQFYKWFTELESAMKSETEETYRHYVDMLTECIETCDGILNEVDNTLDLFNELQLQHQAVATKTKTLHDACDWLLIEKQTLIEFADALRSKLNYFYELENGDESSDVFKTWNPPQEKTLLCLSKLYRCLEPSVFTGLAQEAVEICSVSIQKASKIIAKRSSQMDGQLFIIKHLLILREKYEDIILRKEDLEVKTSVVAKGCQEHLRRILRGQALFDWSRPTSLARNLSPRVLENQIDAKKDLEKSFKVTCEEFIMSVTKLVVDPMLLFVTKVSAVKGRLSTGSRDQKVDSVLTKPLRDQAFATPEKVAELVQKVTATIQQELPQVMAKTKLYLQNPTTRTILFKPIKTNIVEAHIQVLSLLKSEYSSEEIQNIGMVPIQDLHAQLDNLL